MESTAAATALVTAGTTVATALTTAGTTAAAALTTAGTTVATTLSTTLTAAGTTVAGAITAAGTAAAAAIGAAATAGGAGAGITTLIEGFDFSGAGFATGGKITGPAGIDKVPLWGTAGEFVIKAPAVRQPGVEKLLTQINNQTFGGFAAGGHVEAPAVTKALRSVAQPIQTLSRTLDVQTRRTAVSTVERLLSTAAPIIVKLREHDSAKVGDLPRSAPRMPPSADEFERLLLRLGLLRRAGGGPTDIRMGGMLNGPGTPTSDSLLLLGSTKEFMVQAKAAQQPGALQFLNAFNRGHISMATLREALKDLPHYQAGGPLTVPVAAPAYANGGMVMPTMGTVSSQDKDQRSPIIQQITINSPNGQVSRQTELQVTAAAARGARVADKRNN